MGRQRLDGDRGQERQHCSKNHLVCTISKQWEVIALEQLTSHMAGPQQQRPESPTIARWSYRKRLGVSVVVGLCSMSCVTSIVRAQLLSIVPYRSSLGLILCRITFSMQVDPTFVCSSHFLQFPCLVVVYMYICLYV